MILELERKREDLFLDFHNALHINPAMTEEEKQEYRNRISDIDDMIQEQNEFNWTLEMQEKQSVRETFIQMITVIKTLEESFKSNQEKQEALQQEFQDNLYDDSYDLNKYRKAKAKAEDEELRLRAKSSKVKSELVEFSKRNYDSYMQEKFAIANRIKAETDNAVTRAIESFKHQIDEIEKECRDKIKLTEEEQEIINYLNSNKLITFNHFDSFILQYRATMKGRFNSYREGI